jgi:hypothetical protein
MAKLHGRCATVPRGPVALGMGPAGASGDRFSLKSRLFTANKRRKDKDRAGCEARPEPRRLIDNGGVVQAHVGVGHEVGAYHRAGCYLRLGPVRL